MSLLRIRFLLAVLIGAGVFFAATQVQALPEESIRKRVELAKQFESTFNWEKAREIYEGLLGQDDPGLKIRARYHHALRRCWQARRHQDPSYRKEVLSVKYGNALDLCNLINKTMLEGAVDKKNLDSTKLFHKGLEELDHALGDPQFLEQHVAADKQGDVAEFRATLKRVWGNLDNLTPEEAIKQVGQVASIAKARLGLNLTTVVMEFACGACYAVDDFTAYLTPNQLRELAQSLSRSEAVGIGMTITIRDNRIYVHDVRFGGPAFKAGINKNDQILRVDKKSVADLPLHAVNELLEGPAGSTVEIEYMSPLDMRVEDPVLVQREAVITGDIYSLDMNTSIGYLKLNSFTDGTVPFTDTAIGNMSRNGMKGLILDLRQNYGGNFQSAIDVAQRFLDRGIITSLQHQDSKLNVVYQAKNPNALTIPLMVLVDNDTASAAEVLAGALKDNDRGTLIGQTTFGKGCTQAVLKLPKAAGGVPTGGMKLTVARFYSPKGVAYSGRGIVPHFLIDDRDGDSQAAMMRDLCKEKAIEELTRLFMQKQ